MIKSIEEFAPVIRTKFLPAASQNFGKKGEAAMTISEVTAKTVQTEAIPLKLRQYQQPEFVEAVLENEVFIEKKSVSNLQVGKNFSRLKKSLRKKSVSIL